MTQESAKRIAEEVREALTEQHMNDIWEAIEIERAACAELCKAAASNYFSTKAKAVCLDLSAQIQARGATK